MKEVTIYEQPVNEQMRVCLRLEQLFAHALYTLEDTSIWGSRETLATLMEILNVLDRPDIKTKFTKELIRHLDNFSRLEQTPDIDQQKLTKVLIELEDLIDILHTSTGKIGHELRDNEFLSSIRQHLMTPGGACGFDLPAYHHWLQLPATRRTANLKQWLQTFATIHAAVNLLLRLIRQSQTSQRKLAAAGFFQSALDPQLPCQLIQVILPNSSPVYPEVSVGRHGLFIRFFTANILERPQQTTEEIEFWLTTCIL